jgi:hypothetical protein
MLLGAGPTILHLVLMLFDPPGINVLLELDFHDIPSATVGTGKLWKEKYFSVRGTVIFLPLFLPGNYLFCAQFKRVLLSVWGRRARIQSWPARIIQFGATL